MTEMIEPGTPGVEHATRRVWQRDFVNVATAIENGGWVIAHDDGSQSISPDCPPDLARLHVRLAQIGYAKGWMP